MNASRTLVFESRLAAAPERVWQHAVSLCGINHEIRPLARMTGPRGVDDLTGLAEAAGPGRPIFRSWILAGGLLPVERSEVTLEEAEIGRRFVEASPMLFAAEWRHERTIDPVPGGCRLRDALRLRSRIPGGTPVMGLLVRVLFRHRHRRLAALFGALAAVGAPQSGPGLAEDPGREQRKRG